MCIRDSLKGRCIVAINTPKRSLMYSIYHVVNFPILEHPSQWWKRKLRLNKGFKHLRFSKLRILQYLSKADTLLWATLQSLLIWSLNLSLLSIVIPRRHSFSDSQTKSFPIFAKVCSFFCLATKRWHLSVLSCNQDAIKLQSNHSKASAESCSNFLINSFNSKSLEKYV